MKVAAEGRYNQAAPVSIGSGDIDGDWVPLDLGGVVGAKDETAPVDDTAISGLNGRLQRIAQRLTSLLAQIVALPGTRRFVVKGDWNANLTTAYAASQNVAGVKAVQTGLPAGTVIAEGARFQLKALNPHVTTTVTLSLHAFDTNPAGTTFTDGSAITLAAADLANLEFVGAAATSAAGAAAAVQWSATLPRMTVGAGGFLWFAFTATGAFQLSNAGALKYSLEGTW